MICWWCYSHVIVRTYFVNYFNRKAFMTICICSIYPPYIRMEGKGGQGARARFWKCRTGGKSLILRFIRTQDPVVGLRRHACWPNRSCKYTLQVTIFVRRLLTTVRWNYSPYIRALRYSTVWMSSISNSNVAAVSFSKHHHFLWFLAICVKFTSFSYVLLCHVPSVSDVPFDSITFLNSLYTLHLHVLFLRWHIAHAFDYQYVRCCRR